MQSLRCWAGQRRRLICVWTFCDRGFEAQMIVEASVVHYGRTLATADASVLNAASQPWQPAEWCFSLPATGHAPMRSKARRERHSHRRRNVVRTREPGSRSNPLCVYLIAP